MKEFLTAVGFALLWLVVTFGLISFVLMGVEALWGLVRDTWARRAKRRRVTRRVEINFLRSALDAEELDRVSRDIRERIARAVHGPNRVIRENVDEYPRPAYAHYIRAPLGRG